MSLEFNSRLEDIPAYPAAETYEFGGELVKLASNETPCPSAPAGAGGGRGAAAHPQPLSRPGQVGAAPAHLPSATGVPAGRVAVGNGSCELLLAAAEALLEPGRRARLRVAVVLDVPAPGGG